MSHKLTKREKAQKGGKLARAFGLKLDAKSGLFIIPDRGWKIAATAEQVFDIAHEAMCEVEAKKKV